MNADSGQADMTKYTILVIEDDEIVAKTIEHALKREDFRVIWAPNGQEGLKQVRKQPVSLVLLDVIMPGMDGYDVGRELRSDPRYAEIPIIFLTAKTKDEEHITGFLAGADDYLNKPFNVDELILRIRALLRRVKSSNRYVVSEGSRMRASSKRSFPAMPKSDTPRVNLSVGPFELDVTKFELSTPERGRVRLTPVQFDLLYHMMSHPGEIYPPGRLLDEVWNYPDDAGSPDLVRVHIKLLRERIEADPKQPSFLKTVTGFGYTVSAED